MTGGTSNAGGALGAIFRDFTAGLANHTEATAPGVLKALAAVLYAGTSLFIVFANKLLFATWGFPSYPFLALAQYVTTAMVLYLRKRSQVRAHNAAVAAAIASGGGGGGGGGAGLAGSVGGGAGARGGAGRRTNVARGLRTPAPHTVGSAASFTIPQQPQWLYPDVTWGSLRAVMPLPLLFFANTVTGLGATKNLNVPMFVLLRRFSIIMTMGFEMYLLARRPSRTVQISVVLMVVSAAIAAYGDLEMNATGYWLILLNDVFTALQGVVLRSKLDEGQKRRDAQPKRTSPNENNSTTGGAAQGGDGASLTLTTRQAILNAAAGHGQPIVISGPSMPLPPSSPNTGNTDTTAVNVAPSDSSSGASTPRANNVVNLASARGPKPTESPSATQWTPPAGQQQQQQQQNPALVRQHALSADSLMFYNALCSIPLALGLFLSRPEEVHAMMAFHEWDKPAFLVCFASSMFLGFAMNYSYFLCTKVNSPLTTTVIGSLKNIVSTYLGMLIDFKPHFINFIGINLSVVATLVYSYDEVKRVRDRYAAASQQQQPQPPASTTTAV